MQITSPSFLFAVLAIALTACSPHLDWRDVHVQEGAYSIAMPATPTSATRDIDLNGRQVSMNMTATEIDGITFAVGTAVLPDAGKAQAALADMQAALVRNIAGSLTNERTLIMPFDPNGSKGTLAVYAIEAEGRASAATDDKPRVLHARFLARENRVYQIVVTGAKDKVTKDMTDVYFSSFNWN